jgi:protein phosphatase 1L
VEVKGRIMFQSYPNLSPYKPQKCTNDSGYTGSIIAMRNTEKWFQGSGRIANISGGGFSEFPSCRFGYSSVTGKGDYMHVFHEISELDRQDIRLFTVVDGHGYQRAAYNIARHLFDNLLKHPKLFDDTKLAIVETYKQTDQDYLREEDDPQSIVGSTTCTAVLVGKHLLIANVGDSRAVSSRGGNAVTLSWDHKPIQTDEQKRIVDMGGILIWDGTWQVPGGGVSRAFGDRLLKQYVAAEPDIQEVTIAEGVDFLVLASAGLWDVVSNQNAVSIVLEYISDVEEAANRLIEEACHRGSVKNITCVVVCFNLNHLLQSRS